MKSDEHWMRLAIAEARLGEGRVEPNPAVGCVLVRDDQCLARGHHARYGGDHAEVAAIQAAAAEGQATTGATAYVTLEPCCHHGKTPPCTDALLKAGVARVVVALTDPFPQVAGGGIAKLREAGIQVDIGILPELVTDLLAPYLKRVRTGKPWAIAKWAMSLDGRIATTTGQSQWITGAAARQTVHQLRNRVDAIAVGMGTVNADDPRLTVRMENVDSERTDPPARVIFARHRLPDLKSNLVTTAGHVPTWLLAGPHVDVSDLARLADHDVETWRADSDDPVEMVAEALRFLGGSGNPAGKPVTNLMLEGGGELVGSFLSAGEIDEIHCYLGGKVIGGSAAPGPVGGAGEVRLPADGQFQRIAMDSWGDDVRLIYRRR